MTGLSQGQTVAVTSFFALLVLLLLIAMLYEELNG